MNFKRNCFSIITLLGSVFLITACGKSNDFVQYKYLDEVTISDKPEAAKDGSWVKEAQFESYWASTKTIIDPVFGELKQELGTTYEVLNNYTGSKILNSEGERKLLVVPVDFADYQFDINHEDYVENVRKAFFGSAKNNKYVSVAEYYNRSSYGKLRIKGKVCDKFFTFQKNVTGEAAKELRREDVKEAYNYVITDWYQANYHKSIDEFRLDPMDPESPVAMYFVYAHPTDNANFFWAYTFEDTPLSWSSYTTMDTFNGEPDAHTFIHEVGHMFGLKDYYPTEDTDAVEPTGRLDMMDCSVGDHTGFSKMVLNWTRPYHVKNSTKIKIRPLVSSGDLILIKNNWNGTVFDEYYLLEMYVPLGLNFFDSNIGNSKAKLPSLPGIKIYHVDARLGYFHKETAHSTSLTFDGYCNVTGNGDPNVLNPNIRIAHDNSTPQTVTEVKDYRSNYLYELELNHVGHPEAACATNINLFHKDDSFTIKEENFNEQPNNTFFKIDIKSISYTSATIEIIKTN